MRQSSLAVTVALLAAAACGDNGKTVQPPPDGGSPTQATCDVTAGNTTTLLKGSVLTSDMVYDNGQVAIDSTGHITCVGTTCAVGGETTINCHDAVISPGLINTHDHISFDQNNPYTDTGERYDDRQQWRDGLDGHNEIPDPSSTAADKIGWTELRFVMGGATSIVSTQGVTGFLRNLDAGPTDARQEGLGKPGVTFDTFPLDDSSGGRQVNNCGYGSNAETAAQLQSIAAYEPHTSEGIDLTAHNEFLCQSSAIYDAATPGVSNDLMISKTAMIHAIALNAADYGAMASRGTSMIWSPRSNITLYGDTARVSVAARLGVNIALGTDWIITGSMNLERELACADSFNTKYLDHFFTDQQLWEMVTINAAKITATDDVLGSLAPGKVADIAVFAAHGNPSFRSVIAAQPQDVLLVMRGGKVLYGDNAPVNALAKSCDTVDVCGTSKGVCAMGEVGKTYAALQTSVGASDYPAFTCGAPPDEPTCTPRRPTSLLGSTIYTGIASATDSDGDGIPDASDNCPHVFNPIRPMDNGKQADADGDGVGDSCDPCPLDANTTTCTPVVLTDRDHDGVPDQADNCPNDPNPDQADDDHDGHGNACDLCPHDANPGLAGCPYTIYQLKSGLVPDVFPAHLAGALVTAISNVSGSSNGFFVQVKETDAGYAGAASSGIFIFTKSLATVTVGQRVTIDGAVDTFRGEIELDNLTGVTAATNTSEAPPVATSISYADVAGGTATAAQLEGALVTLGPSTVTAVSATTLTLTDGASHSIVVDSFLTASPSFAMGEPVVSATGVLAFRGGAFKLEPRSSADVISAAPKLGSLGPALSFVRLTATNNPIPTFPLPLTVALTGPAQADTTIALASSNPDALTVANVVIPAGAISATVPVTAVAQAADVKITATLGTKMATADVRVLGAVEAPSAVTLAPATATVHPGDTVALIATLDAPALGDSPLTITVTPGGAGTIAPATVTVPDGQVAATFTFTNAAASGTVAISASVNGGTPGTSTLTVATGHLVISQVYGAGGNANATLKNDFIEIHNASSVAVTTTGMSVQYTGAKTNAWQVTALVDGNMHPLTIPAGGYLLVQEAAGSGGTVALSPDVTGTISMSGTAAKVALVSSTTALAVGCPTSLASVIDFVGYGGGTSVDCFEGTGPAPALPNNASSVARGQNGCTDTDDNSKDFTAVTAAPRNAATTPATCQ